MQKNVLLVFFLFVCCRLYAQNVQVSGDCMAGSYMLPQSGTFHGKPYYETTGTVAGNTGIKIQVYWIEPPDNVWVLAYDGQPYYSSDKDTPEPPGTAAFTWTSVEPAPCPSPGTLSITGDVALWVAFGTVSAQLKNNSLYVNWQTVTEKENDHFEIEASKDGAIFKAIAHVPSKAANGNSDQLISYEWSAGANAVSLAAVSLAAAAFFLLLAFRRRKNTFVPITAILLVIIGMAWGCKKNKNEIDTNAPSFIRVAQVDKDGTRTYSKVIKVIQE